MTDRENLKRLGDQCRFTQDGRLAALRAWSPPLGCAVWYVIIDGPVDLPNDNTTVIWASEIALCENTPGWDCESLIRRKQLAPRAHITTLETLQ